MSVPSLEPIFIHIVPFLLVLFRLSGLAVFAPILGSAVIPLRARALLMFMFAVVLYPVIPAPAVELKGEIDLFTLAPLIAAETLIGVSIGLLAALPMYAVQLGGQVMGQQIGLGLAGIYNPALDTESDVIGQMLMFIAVSIFAAVGGLDALFLSLARTFNAVPPGAAGGVVPPLDLMLAVVGSGFDMALRVAAPVLCIILVETIAMGFLSKTLPQLNIMSIGFASKVVLALLVLIWGMGAIGEAIGDDVRESLATLTDWISPAGGGGAAPAGR